MKAATPYIVVALGVLVGMWLGDMIGARNLLSGIRTAA